jgi:hypothetical protein
MDAVKSRDASKIVKPATAWSEANSSGDNRNTTASTAEGRPTTTRMPEIVETSQRQYSVASVGMPTAQYGRQQLMIFHGNSQKNCQNGEKFDKKDVKKIKKNSPFFVL